MESVALWNRYMQCYDSLTRVESYARSMVDIVNAVDPSPGLRVLDAGSGTGNLSELLNARGADVVSLDFSDAALKCHGKKNPSARLLRASLEKPLPLASSSFDAVCCASVLFALSRAGCEGAMREFHRVLRPGGRLIVTVATPAKRNSTLLAKHLRSIMRRSLWRAVVELPAMARLAYYNWALRRLPDWQGYHRFTEEELSGLFAASRFDNLQITSTYGGSFFLAEARKPQSLQLGCSGSFSEPRRAPGTALSAH